MSRIVARLAAGVLVAGSLVLTAGPALASTEGTKVNGPYPLGLCQRYAADAARQGIGRVTECFPGYGGYYFTWII
ncbi:hypothetical protein [Pseudonocardia sp. GCM10023141]|uniref:hypothetical protein n=1 Tax=Pseudonocardia sp. GCM10023141 TaxID=3252653 RepID=UPI00360DA688